MGMATLQFYKNKYKYPHYSNTITAYGSPMPCTPVGINLRGGTIRVKGEFSFFINCNYLSITRDGVNLYAWVTDVNFRTNDSFDVTYKVDAWRSYKDSINLGYQYIARRPTVSTKKDKLLGRTVHYSSTNSYEHAMGNTTTRFFVVQVRPSSGEPFSNSPVQPTPYQFFVTEYNVNNWTANTSLYTLMRALRDGAEPENIVTMYSIPYIKYSELPQLDLTLKTSGESTTISGFRCLNGVDPSNILNQSIPLELSDYVDIEVEHSVSIVIPEAGILNVPDEFVKSAGLAIRQDVDLFSGASNYMLTNYDKPFTQSVRGSSITSIPIISDPLDTYLSQNQNALATSMMGDIASTVQSSAMGFGMGGVPGAIGGAAAGIMGIVGQKASQSDMSNKAHNPPAFLGTSLATCFNKKFWVVVSQMTAHNTTIVNDNFGYPWEMIDQLVFPTKGFIQTEGCAVTCDGNVPVWALDEINTMFNNGVCVY